MFLPYYNPFCILRITLRSFLCLTQDFQRRFTERFRKLDCHDLLAEKDIEGTPAAQELGVTQHCRLLVVSGVELLSDMLDEWEAR